MKHLILLFLFPALALAQKQTYTLKQILPTDSLTGEVSYSGVVQVPNVTAQELYSRAKTFYLKTFNNGKYVVQVDEPGKQVSGRGALLLTTNPKPNGLMQPDFYPVTIEIRVKDGRYRYDFSQFFMQLPTGIEMPVNQAFSKVFGKNIAERVVPMLKAWDSGVLGYISQLEGVMSAKSGKKDEF